MTGDEDAVLQECLRAGRAIGRWMGGRLESLGLSPAQLDVLDVLHRGDGIPLNELRDALCCVGSNVTALVDRMERDGLVERRRDTADRRVVRLYLGASGREKLALLGDPRRCCPESLDALDAEERCALVRLLRKLVAGLGECPTAQSEGACCASGADAPAEGECCGDAGEGRRTGGACCAGSSEPVADRPAGAGCCGGPAQAAAEPSPAAAAGCCASSGPAAAACCGAPVASPPSPVQTDPKELVRQAYGRIGAGEQRGCGCGDAADRVSAAIGYGAEEMAAVPEGANLGLGCGNPTAIAGLRPGEVVLDLGSGGGFDCFLSARQVGPEGRVIGVDMTAEMLSRARENARKGGFTNVEFRLGEIEALPVADAGVDVVISNCVINLVPDKARVFREIARVLKPGGRMFVSDMVLLRELPEWAREAASAYVACVSGAVPREEYLRLIREAGLDEVEVLSERDASASFIDPTDPLVNRLIAGRPVEDIRGLVASVNVRASRLG